MTVGLRGAAAAESRDRLEHALELVSLHDRPGVGDRQNRDPTVGSSLYVDPPAGDVVADRVVDEVADQPLDQGRIAHRRRRYEVGDELDRAAVKPRAVRHDADARDGEVQRFAPIEPALAPREREQRLEQRLLLATRREQLLAGGPQRGGTRVGVGERDLQQRPFERERRAQLMGSVGDEPPLGLKRRLETGEQVVERVGEPLELVVGSGQRESPAEVAG